MKQIYKDYLFSKSILVAEHYSKYDLQENLLCLVDLATDLGIKINQGKELVDRYVLGYVLDKWANPVTDPFYVNFPQSVKLMDEEQLLLDQLYHYAETYGKDNFEGASAHSILEPEIDRVLYTEDIVEKTCDVVSEDRGNELLYQFIQQMLANTRPLNITQLDVLCEWFAERKCALPKGLKIASKDTVISLILLMNLPERKVFAKFLSLNDVLKLVDRMINFESFFSGHNSSIYKLKLNNYQRKVVTWILDEILNHVDALSPEEQIHILKECQAKKKAWCGLLHHIHYRPKTEFGKFFCRSVREKLGITSYQSDFIKVLEQEPFEVMVVLEQARKKGTGFVLRNLNYILSRCQTPEQIEIVYSYIKTLNSNINLILIQLLDYLAHIVNQTEPRTFIFTHNNTMRSHKETEKEVSKRKSILSHSTLKELIFQIEQQIENNLHNTLGKVYVDPKLYQIAITINGSTGASGLGVLPTGSRIPLDDWNIRAFTYWEKVNDIDLSAIGLNEDGSTKEFSWRSMYFQQSSAITFSGDETCGYKGGSEFFDISLETFKEQYPNMRYLIFSDNVYSGRNFNTCFCKAGYMLRSDLDKGNVYEPKTVATSFLINVPAIAAYLFAIDLKTKEIIWLNIAHHGDYRIAGEDSIHILNKYLTFGQVFNYEWLFKIAATEVVANPEEAELIVSDTIVPREDQQLVRSCDTEFISNLLNGVVQL